MSEVDEALLTAALWKWRRGEVLARPDMERLIDLFEHADMRIEIPDQGTVAALQTRLRSILQAKYLGGAK